MGGFSDNYECGYWDEETASSQKEKRIKRNNILPSSYDNAYTQKSDLNYIYLMVLLTPISLLSAEGRDMRMNLSLLCNTQTTLRFIYYKEHEKGNHLIEVYYEDIAIGYVEKSVDTMDYTEIVDDFCLRQDGIKKVEVLWDGEEFCLRRKIGLDR